MCKEIVAISIVVFCSLALADGEEVASDSIRTYYLDEIVVSATRVERSVRDLSATVSVITGEDLQASNTKSCMDILNSLPGVFVNKTGDFGRADVDIRGLGDRGRAVMVLTDGRPVKMGLFGCTISHSLPLNDVERIEVVRGPHSVLYGSDALGGVINIVTRKARDGFQTDLTNSFGTHNTRQIQLRHGGRREGFHYYLTGDWRKSDGHLPNSAYGGKDATLKFGYGFTERLGAALSLKVFDGRKEEPRLDRRDPKYSPQPSQVWNEYRRAALDLTVSKKIGPWKGMLKAYRNFGDHLFSDGWDSRDFTNGAVLHASGPLFPANALTLGFDFRHQGGQVVSGSLAGRWDKKEAALFFHDEHILMHRLILTFGARYNQDQQAGGQFCPQAGLVYHLNDSSILRGLVNKGFRAPQINELYIYPARNANLTPEIVWSYEVGVHRRIFTAMELDLSGYVMKGENLIQMVPSDSPAPKFIFQNVLEFEFRGLEACLITRPAKNLQIQTCYAHLDPGEKTTGRPGDKLDLSLRWMWRRLAFSCHGQYVTDYYAQDDCEGRIPDYFIWDMKLSHELLHGWRVFLAVDNLFDDVYAIYANLPGSSAGLYTMPRRRFTMGLNLHL